MTSCCWSPIVRLTAPCMCRAAPARFALHCASAWPGRDSCWGKVDVPLWLHAIMQRPCKKFVAGGWKLVCLNATVRSDSALLNFTCYSRIASRSLHLTNGGNRRCLIFGDEKLTRWSVPTAAAEYGDSSLPNSVLRYHDIVLDEVAAGLELTVRWMCIRVATFACFYPVSRQMRIWSVCVARHILRRSILLMFGSVDRGCG